MSGLTSRRLGWNAIDYADGGVQVWMLPLWMKDTRLVLCELSPRTARQMAIRLLQAADAAEAQP